MNTPDDKPIDRRRFFREGLRELFKPLADGLANVERVASELAALDSPRKPRTVSLTYLRPPGALAERAFLDTCSRCGVCVNVCPAHAIKIDPTGAKGKGVPYIVPEEMPCVVCDGLHCMQNCPSGALVFTALADIDMGTAVWNQQLCVRSQGQECTICIDQCPLGTAAIDLKDGNVHVIEKGCIGCGVCEHYCPTSPRSIVVVPRKSAA